MDIEDMKSIAVMGLEAWDHQAMVETCRLYPNDTVADKDLFIVSKWDEILSAANVAWGERKCKDIGTVCEICRRKGYKVEPELRTSCNVSVPGATFYVEHPFASYHFIVSPFKHMDLPWDVTDSHKVFRGSAWALVQTMEIFGRAMLELPKAYEDAKFDAVKERNISKILLPKFRKDIKSSGVLSGFRYRTDLMTGEYIRLRIFLKGGLEAEGIVNFENYDLVFERLPLALDDQANFAFYLPEFSIYNPTDNAD